MNCPTRDPEPSGRFNLRWVSQKLKLAESLLCLRWARRRAPFLLLLLQGKLRRTWLLTMVTFTGFPGYNQSPPRWDNSLVKRNSPVCGGGTVQKDEYNTGLHVMALFVVLAQSTIGELSRFCWLHKKHPRLLTARRWKADRQVLNLHSMRIPNHRKTLPQAPHPAVLPFLCPSFRYRCAHRNCICTSPPHCLHQPARPMSPAVLERKVSCDCRLNCYVRCLPRYGG